MTATREETLCMIEVRPAHQGDAPKVRALLGLLGYDVPVEDVRKRLSDLAERNTDPVLLATEADMAVGLIAMHRTIMLHVNKPVARITALIVCDEARGKGVGRALVDAGAELARQAGCDLVELTTALHRADAQAFYKAIGFTASSLRFYRSLVDEPIR
jgi:ribosomal protein S18 acetylase RimI-like enzyme